MTVSLSDKGWASLLDCLHGRSAAAPASLSRLPELIEYTGDPLDANEIRKLVGLSQSGSTPDHLYITATAALEKRRAGEGFGSSRQYVTLPGGAAPEPQLMFRKALQYLLTEPLLDSNMERVMIARAIEVVAADPQMEKRLKQDIFSWRDALALLAEKGIDLTLPGAVNHQNTFKTPDVMQTLQALQAAYLKECQNKARSFESAAHDWLVHSPGVPGCPLIIMEGFSRLTDLQQLFIDRNLAMGTRIVIIYPYRPEQQYGFAALRGTYSKYINLGAVPRQVTSSFQGRPTLLRELKMALFSDSLSPAVASDKSVTLRIYEHRNQEVEDILRQIKWLIEVGKVRPDDIKVITLDKEAYKPLILEAAQLLKMQQHFTIPPRRLLLTPAGRFALTLYQIWSNGALEMDAAQFVTLLASGWLGSNAQRTVDEFTTVEYQYFSRCRTKEEWQASLGGLASAVRSLSSAPGNLSGSRLACAGVSGSSVALWQRALEFVIKMCQNLTKGSQRPIGQHIQTLQDQLAALKTSKIRAAELEVLKEIGDALQQLGNYYSLNISAKEFGDIINSMVREIEQDIDDNTPGRVAVIGPEGIDSSLAPYVFYLGMNDQALPRTPADSWPFAKGIDIEDHYNQERYLFLAVVRAAGQRLHLSYAMRAEAQLYGPSIFFDDVSKIVNFQPTVVKRVPVVAKGTAGASPAPSPPQKAPRTQYDLAEIAHFALCPYRYRLERIDTALRLYRSEWQQQFMAQAYWIHHVLAQVQKMQLTKPPVSGRARVERLLSDAKRQTQVQVQRAFPGIHPAFWPNIEEHVDNFIQEWLDYWVAPAFDTYKIRIKLGEEGEFHVTVDKSDIVVQATTQLVLERGGRVYPCVTPALLREWMLPASRPDKGTGTRPDFQAVPVFQHAYDVIKWWRKGLQLALNDARKATIKDPAILRQHNDQVARFKQQLVHIVKNIEAGPFPKNPGPHCKTCPARNECLGQIS